MFGYLLIIYYSDVVHSYSITDLYSRNVWLYYDGEMIQTIERLVSRINQTLTANWTVHFLTPLLVSNYLDVGTFPPLFRRYSPQAQSDLIRLQLLYRYGGWWIDVSTILKNDYHLEVLRWETIQQKATLFGFCFLQCPRMLIENSILYAPRWSPSIKAWHDEYLNALRIGRVRYIYQRYRDGIDFPYQLFVSYPKVNTYFSAYAAERVALSRIIPRHSIILIAEANNTIYQLFADCCWGKACAIQSLQSEIIKPSYNMTKVWSSWRYLAWSASGLSAGDRDHEPKVRGLEVLQSVNINGIRWEIYLIVTIILFISNTIVLFPSNP